MAANEKVINLVIKAQDQYSRVLKNAQNAVSGLAKRQQLKLDLTTNIRKSENEFKAAAAEAKQLSMRLKGATAASEGGVIALGKLSIATQQARSRAGEAKIAFASYTAQLRAMTGSAKGSFLAFSRTADGLQLQASAANAAAPATQQLTNASIKAAKAQGAQKVAIDATTKAMQRQAAVPLPGARRGGLSQGVKGERQDIALFGLKPYQLTNLAYQANDVISGIAMGQRPTQILAQQLGQVLQIFPAFTKVFFTAIPIVSAFAVVLGPVVANLVAMNEQAKNTELFASRLALLADSAGYTAEGLAKIAATAGGVEVVSDLVSKGFKQDRIAEFAAAASRMAAVTGQEVPEAVAKLADAFTGGYDALRDYDKQTNLFTDSELDAIRAMYDAGDAAKAQEFAFDALQSKLNSTVSKQGAWSNAIGALGGAWESFLNLFKDSLVEGFVTASIEGIANSVRNTAEDITLIVDTLNRAAGGAPIGSNVELFNLGDTAEFLRNAKQGAQDAIDTGMLRGEARKEAEAEIANIDRQIAEINTRRKAMVSDIGSPSSTGLVDDQGSEAYNKRVDDLAASLGKVNTERQASVALAGEEGRIAAESLARTEAETQAKQNNVSVTDAKVKAEIDGFVATALASYDAEQNAKTLAQAEERVTQAAAEQRTERENQEIVLNDLIAAHIVLANAYGKDSSQAKAAEAAIAGFNDAMATAEGRAYALSYAASALGQALATIGQFSADLDSQLNDAQFRVDAAAAGLARTRIDAMSEVNAATKESNATLLREGKLTVDQVAAQTETLVKKKERLAALRDQDQANIRAAAQAASGGAGGGGSGGPSSQEAQEQKVNDLLTYREALLERIAYYQGTGNTQMADELKGALVGVNSELTTAVDGMIALLSAMGGPEAQTMLLNMQKIREQITGSTTEIQKNLPTAIELNEQLADVGVSAFDKMAEAIANGQDAATAFFDTVRQGFAQFLLQIAGAIAKQALLNALQGGGGPGGGVGKIISTAIGSIFHGGGVVGGPARTRGVHPSVFANAMRYHTGGVAGLKPNEVPAILERGEEVLTADDPRRGGAMPANVKIVNVLDAGDVVSKGLATEAGQQSFLNFVTRNPRAFRAALGG